MKFTTLLCTIGVIILIVTGVWIAFPTIHIDQVIMTGWGISCFGGILLSIWNPEFDLRRKTRVLTVLAVLYFLFHATVWAILFFGPICFFFIVSLFTHEWLSFAIDIAIFVCVFATTYYVQMRYIPITKQ